MQFYGINYQRKTFSKFGFNLISKLISTIVEFLSFCFSNFNRKSFIVKSLVSIFESFLCAFFLIVFLL